MAQETGFISLYGPDSLPDTIPESVRQDMVGVPLPFRYEQKNTAGIRGFDVSHLFPETPKKPVFVNSIIAGVALRAFGFTESGEYWLEQTAEISAPYIIENSPPYLGLKTKADVRASVDKQAEELYPIYGNGRIMTGTRLNGGLPMARDSGKVQDASDQLDDFIELGMGLFGFKYVNHFAADSHTNQFLVNYAYTQVKTGTVNVPFWRMLARLSSADPEIALFLKPARYDHAVFPKKIAEILFASGIDSKPVSFTN